jgi:hypothetical protein
VKHFIALEIAEGTMPLTRGTALGYDEQRMIFAFTMLNKTTETITCEISSSAMDELAGKRGTLPIEREAQFFRFREAIERIASHNFDEGSVTHEVQVFAKHIKNGAHHKPRS